MFVLIPVLLFCCLQPLCIALPLLLEQRRLNDSQSVSCHSSWLLVLFDYCAHTQSNKFC